MAQNPQINNNLSKTLKDGDMIDLTSEYEAEDCVDDDVVEVGVLDTTKTTTSISNENNNKTSPNQRESSQKPAFIDTSVEKMFEDGDIILSPSPLEVRKRKFPIDPPSEDLDDDVIFLPNESPPPVKVMVLQKPQLVPTQMKSQTSHTKGQPATAIPIRPVRPKQPAAKTQLVANSGQKISFQRTLVKQSPHQMSKAQVSKSLANSKATPNKNIQCSTQQKLQSLPGGQMKNQNKHATLVAPATSTVATDNPAITPSKFSTNQTTTMTRPGAPPSRLTVTPGKPLLTPASKLGTPNNCFKTNSNFNMIGKKNSTGNSVKPFPNCFSPGTQYSAKKFSNLKKVGISENISQEELTKAVRSISTSDQTPENKKQYLIINYQNVGEFQQKKTLANSKPSPARPNLQPESTVSNIVIENVFSTVENHDALSNLPPAPRINKSVLTRETNLIDTTEVHDIYNQSLILKRQSSTVTITKKTTEAVQEPPKPMLKDPLTGQVVKNKQLQKCFSDMFDSSFPIAKDRNAKFSGILLNSNHNADNSDSSKGKVLYLLYPVDELLDGEGKIDGGLSAVGQIDFRPPVVNTEPSVSVIPPPTFTPVDINQIINRGKKTPNVFVGFKKQEMIKPLCCKELHRIIKTEEKKIDTLKELMKAHNEINFVRCSADSNYYLPEFDVKTEPEDDDVIVVEEEIMPEAIPSKIVSRVKNFKNQVSKISTDKNALQLTKTKEALELIQKGLQMIQNMSKEGDMQVKKRRGRPKKNTDTQPVQNNFYESKISIGNNVNKKEKRIDDDDLLLLKRVAVVTGKRRGRRRKTDF